jgi:hypothetical protein
MGEPKNSTSASSAFLEKLGYTVSLGATAEAPAAEKLAGHAAGAALVVKVEEVCHFRLGSDRGGALERGLQQGRRVAVFARGSVYGDCFHRYPSICGIIAYIVS